LQVILALDDGKLASCPLPLKSFYTPSRTTGCQVRRVPDTTGCLVCRVLGTGCWAQGAGYTGCWCWVHGAGYTGCWAQGAGYTRCQIQQGAGYAGLDNVLEQNTTTLVRVDDEMTPLLVKNYTLSYHFEVIDEVGTVRTGTDILYYLHPASSQLQCGSYVILLHFSHKQ